MDQNQGFYKRTKSAHTRPSPVEERMPVICSREGLVHAVELDIKITYY